MEKKLNAARASWLKGFWKASGLAAFKADNTDQSSDDALYFDDAGAALTVYEASALKKIVAALTGNGYSQALYDEMALAVEAGWISGGEIVKEAADLQAGWDVVPTATLEAIKEKADAFAFMVNAREQQALYEVIDAAVANGDTVGALAGTIADTFAEGYHVTNADGEVVKRVPTDSWSETVARTELNRAQTFGQMSIYQSAGIQRVVWMTNHGGTVCDACNETDGTVVDLGDNFEGVDCDSPPAHPACCCALLPADEDVISPYVQDMIDNKEAA